MTCTNESPPLCTPCTKPVQVVRRIEGDGCIALVFISCYGGNTRGLALVLSMAEGLDLSNVAADLYGQAFAKHALPGTAIIHLSVPTGAISFFRRSPATW